MELAKGQININLSETGIENIYTIKMFSGAIPDQISKKPKIIKTKMFKEDAFKKIETETLIGELQFQIIEELKEKEVKKVQNMTLQKQPWFERESPIYFLFLNIDKISNVTTLFFSLP